MLGLLFFGAAMASLGLTGLGAGRLEWAALMIAGTAVCVTGVRVRIAAEVNASRSATGSRLRVRPLERAVEVLWTVGAGAALALGVVRFSAGQPGAGVVYLMCAGTCALGLLIQVAGARGFARHAR